MTVSSLRKLESQFLSDQSLSADEAQKLVSSTWDAGSFSKEERTELKTILDRNASKLLPAARQTIERYLGKQDNAAPVAARCAPPTPPR